jgi:hypothetical protein
MIPQMQMARECAVILMAPALAHLGAKVKRRPLFNSARLAGEEFLRRLALRAADRRGASSQGRPPPPAPARL